MPRQLHILFVFTATLFETILCKSDLTYSTNINEAPISRFKFNLLNAKDSNSRKKREDAVLFQHENQDDNSPEDEGFPSLNGTNHYNESFTDNFKYYEMTIFKPDAGKFSEYWIDIPNLLQNNSKPVKGELRHKQLANSYRRAVSQKLSFRFPFYGHPTENVTIATGGFVYAGDQVHSWLAATQYIAPLMANFDTTSSEDSNILYADTGDLFVVEWNQVVLRHQAESGNFTFQASLHKNGDIWFVYKNIPIEIKRVSDLHHPRKVGLSDAYLFTHTVLTLSRRVIYEYHRVEVDLNHIKSGAVVLLTAQKVCISLKNCKDCVGANLPSFNCTWCDTGSDSPEQGGDDHHGGGNSQQHISAIVADQGGTGGSFCSDREGLNRRRQEYLDSMCHKEVDHMYCSDETQPQSAVVGDSDPSPQHHSDGGGVVEEEEVVAAETTTTLSSAATTTTTKKLATTAAVATEPKTTTVDKELPSNGSFNPPNLPPIGQETSGVVNQLTRSEHGNSAAHGGIAALLLILTVVISATSWLFYAYSNPQTPSGQFLIRNRPALWKWPGNHANVRYTASSVHM